MQWGISELLLIRCTKVSAFKVLCPFLNVYSLKGSLKNEILCIFMQLLLPNNHWKPVTSHSICVFRCHHRDLTKQVWRKAEKQHLWQQVSQLKKAASPFPSASWYNKSIQMPLSSSDSKCPCIRFQIQTLGSSHVYTQRHILKGKMSIYARRAWNVHHDLFHCCPTLK